MKITTPRHSRRNVTILVSLLLVATVLAYVVYVKYRSDSQDAAPQNPITKDQSSYASSPQTPQDASRKQEYIDNAIKQEQQGNQGTQENTPQPPQPSSDTISLSAQRANNDSVTVYTQLAPIASGTCTLTVTNGSKTTTQKAEIIYQLQHSLCAGFSVPVSTVGTGDWSLKLSVEAPSGVAEKTISYGVK